MTAEWQILSGNLATVALITLIWMHLSYRLYRLSPMTQRLCFGAALGLAAVVSMVLSVEFEPGIYFDLRLALVSIAGAFAGPVSLVVTATMAIAYRIYMGGAGTLPGITGVLVVATVGAIVWFAAGRRMIERPHMIIAVSALTGALSLILPALLSPPVFYRALEQVALPIAVLNFLATAAAGFTVVYFRRFTLERDILYAALTQAPEYHYVKDLEHRFVVTNLNVANHNGRERSSQMVGLTDFDLAPADRAQALRDAERQVLDTGEALTHFEEFLIEQGKGPRWYSTSKVPLRNRHGELIGLAGVTVDVTDKKTLEHELETSRDVMARAMAEMSDGLALFDAAGYLIFCNEQYRVLFPRSSYARREGAHITDIVRAVFRNGERKDVPADVGEEQIQAAAATLHTNKDEIIPLTDGRWLALRTRLATDGSALAMVSDITAMKEAELSLKRLADQMQGLAQTDSLTGLANRRSFDETLSNEVSQALRTGSPLAMLLVDVDRFKLFNDSYGHLAGDECLRRVANCIGGVTKRPVDLAARYGGEEFAVLLPDTMAEAAVLLAERIRGAIRGLQIVHSGSEFGVVTASIGISMLSQDAGPRSAEGLVGAADDALYQSKRTGRDRVQLMVGETVGLSGTAEVSS